jgi:hypothetical protein
MFLSYRYLTELWSNLTQTCQVVFAETCIVSFPEGDFVSQSKYLCLQHPRSMCPSKKHGTGIRKLATTKIITNLHSDCHTSAWFCPQIHGHPPNFMSFSMVCSHQDYRVSRYPPFSDTPNTVMLVSIRSIVPKGHQTDDSLSVKHSNKIDVPFRLKYH